MKYLVNCGNIASIKYCRESSFKSQGRQELWIKSSKSLCILVKGVHSKNNKPMEILKCHFCLCYPLQSSKRLYHILIMAQLLKYWHQILDGERKPDDEYSFSKYCLEEWRISSELATVGRHASFSPLAIRPEALIGPLYFRCIFWCKKQCKICNILSVCQPHSLEPGSL